MRHSKRRKKCLLTVSGRRRSFTKINIDVVNHMFLDLANGLRSGDIGNLPNFLR